MLVNNIFDPVLSLAHALVENIYALKQIILTCHESFENTTLLQKLLSVLAE